MIGFPHAYDCLIFRDVHDAAQGMPSCAESRTAYRLAFAGQKADFRLQNSSLLVLRTARLELVACTLELVRAEAAGPRALAAAIGVAEPEQWPPPLNDESSQRWVYQQLEHDPTMAGWTLWYFVLPGNPRLLIGNGGFKGRAKDGLVEIGYSILPEFQRNGYATEATRALISWAFSHADINRVAAETLPELQPSLVVMGKCGMKYMGKGAPEEGMETVHYELSRDEFQIQSQEG